MSYDFLKSVAPNVWAMVSAGFRRTKFSVLHLAKFTIFSLINNHAKL